MRSPRRLVWECRAGEIRALLSELSHAATTLRRLSRWVTPQRISVPLHDGGADAAPHGNQLRWAKTRTSFFLRLSPSSIRLIPQTKVLPDLGVCSACFFAALLFPNLAIPGRRGGGDRKRKEKKKKKKRIFFSRTRLPSVELTGARHRCIAASQRESCGCGSQPGVRGSAALLLNEMRAVIVAELTLALPPPVSPCLRASSGWLTAPTFAHPPDRL